MKCVWDMFPEVASVRTVQHDRCEAKTAKGNLYPSAECAGRAASDMSRKTGQRIVAYVCPVCGGHHVGKSRE